MSAQRIASVIVGCFLLPAATWAQQANGTIAGVVKDASAAVMPGVTVEAASPALIEKVRTVVTDGQGQFKIVDLRPGSYVVTFTLAGFSTLRREGIDLTAGFTATVNGELKVGALEETVTVTGAAPVVDTQSVQQQTTVQQNIPGFPMAATYITSNAQIKPSLGRDLGSCRGAAVCNGTVTLGDATTAGLFPLNSFFEDRIQQLDLRAGRACVQIQRPTRVLMTKGRLT